MHYHILLNYQIVLTKKVEFELMLFNSASSVRIFGIINDVCHLKTQSRVTNTKIKQVYKMLMCSEQLHLVIANGQLNLSQEFVWVVWLYELTYHS